MVLVADSSYLWEQDSESLHPSRILSRKSLSRESLSRESVGEMFADRSLPATTYTHDNNHMALFHQMVLLK